ncbi:MAG TPA: MFS transporter [Stellaceae bacterium]|nr:MFS transporter [Stellaceae bacterium]
MAAEARREGVATVDIGELLDEQKLSLYHLGTIVLCLLIIIVDAADTGSGNVSGPAILRAFPADRSVLGWVFASAGFGVFFGSLIFGYIGDRYGRRLGVILSVLLYSVPELCTMFSGSLEQIMMWRFLTGLGIGGAIPNTIALLNEAAPKRFRASFVVIAFLGYATGTALAGLIAAKLNGIYGWYAVFVVVGAAGLVLSALLYLRLPESIRFLTVTQPFAPRLRQQAMRVFSDAGIGPATRFIMQHEKSGKGSLRDLFAGDLKLTTPLLWLSYFFESFTYLGYTAWLTTIMEAQGLTQQQAAFAFSYAGWGGIVMLLCLARPLDKVGPLASVVSASLCVAMLISIGASGLTVAAYTILATVAHACGSGTHNSLNSTVAMFYPTRIRSNGVGWATAAGRIGGAVGPLTIGYVFSAKFSLDTVLYVVAGPYLAVIVLNIMLGLIYRRQFAAAPAVAGE